MIQAIWDDWCEYWFSPASTKVVTWVRVVLCTCCAVWFASFLSHANSWFGENGILSGAIPALMLEYDDFSRWQTWSPLWWTSSSTAVRAYLVVGCLLAITAAAGVGGRWTMGALVLMVIAWCHRIVWLLGIAEPALIGFLLYLVVEPGNPLLAKASSQLPKATWQAGLSLRLLQTHWWILVAAGLLSQLGSLVWWRGDGAWWLAAADRSLLLSRDQLSTSPLLVNAFTHGVVVVEVLALWLLIPKSTRRIGIFFGVFTCIAIGLIADHLLYAAFLASVLVAFASRGIKER